MTWDCCFKWFSRKLWMVKLHKMFVKPAALPARSKAFYTATHVSHPSFTHWNLHQDMSYGHNPGVPFCIGLGISNYLCEVHFKFSVVKGSYIHIYTCTEFSRLGNSPRISGFQGKPKWFSEEKKRSRRKKNSQKKTKALGEKITYYIHGLNTQVLIHVLWFTVQKELNFVPGEAWHPQEMSIINFGW